MSTSVSLLNQTFLPLAKIFGEGMTASHTGSHFTCSEADEIALALYASGHEKAAVTWLLGHAEGEDWDDKHAHQYDPEKDADRQSPRPFTEAEIREYLRKESQHYLEALVVMANA